jgi:hypothetical protein
MTSIYDQARERVLNTPKLVAHEETCLDEWGEGDPHFEWVATAPIAEIVSWAEGIEQDAHAEALSQALADDPTSLQCRHCWSIWRPRNPAVKPIICPRCKSYNWERAPIKPGRRPATSTS